LPPPFFIYHQALSGCPGHAEAYRTIPIKPTQPAFSCSSSAGIYGNLADASTDIFRSEGIGPISKWVDDFTFFCIPQPKFPNTISSISITETLSPSTEAHKETEATSGSKELNGRMDHSRNSMTHCRPPFAPFQPPFQITDVNAFSDASSGTGIAFLVGCKWKAWRLLPEWQSDG
jgi:hypothetical protein